MITNNNSLQEFGILTKLLCLPQNTANGLSELLLKDQSDIEEFYINFFGKNKYLSDDLYDFRENKIRSRTYGFEDLVSTLVKEGMKKALEEAFIQKFSDDDIDFITQSLYKKQTSLETIFDAFQNNINLNILRYVL